MGLGSTIRPDPPSEGFCSFCERTVRLTAHGVLVVHDTAPHAGGEGPAPAQCPGSDLTPRLARDLAVMDALRSPPQEWPGDP
jgi:hypothetical protein